MRSHAATRRPRLFYGWYVVGACFVALFVQAGIGFYAFGPFFTPLEAEFGWSRAEIAAAISLINVVWGLSGPFVGRLVDAVGPRKVMIGGAAGMGACLIAFAGVSTLWLYYVVFLISALPRAALSPIPVGPVITNWFVERRGLAMGMAMFGIGVGGLTMAPLSSFLISLSGWRWTTIILGLITIAVTVPVIALVVRPTPRELGLQPYGATVEGNQAEPGPEPANASDRRATSLTFQQALKTPAYWLISVAFFLVFIGMTALPLHLVPFLEDQGQSPQLAATILALVAGMGGIGKLTWGYVGDKIPARFAMAICFILQSIGFAIIMLPMNAVTIPIFVLFYGMGMGGVVTLWAIIAAETFGTGSLGTILGGLGVLSTISMTGAPVLAGSIYETTGNYMLAFWLFLFAAIAASGTVIFAKPAVASRSRQRALAAH